MFCYSTSNFSFLQGLSSKVKPQMEEFKQLFLLADSVTRYVNLIKQMLSKYLCMKKYSSAEGTCW